MSTTRPKQWWPSQGPAPVVGLAVSLHQPWQEAFFNGPPEGEEPARWKNVENRDDHFPKLPPGTLLALHVSQTWNKQGAEFVGKRLPEVDLEAVRSASAAGSIIGVVKVREVIHGGNGRAHEKPVPDPLSPWYMTTGCGIWVEDWRIRLPTPIHCGYGQFRVWSLPEAVRAQLEQTLAELTRPTVLLTGDKVRSLVHQGRHGMVMEDPGSTHPDSQVLVRWQDREQDVRVPRWMLTIWNWA